MSPLTPRERVLAVLDREQPDQVPIFLGADLTTGVLTAAYRRLTVRLGVDPPERWLYDWPELGAPRMAESVLELLHSDVRGIQDRFPSATYTRNRARPTGSPYLDDWGVGHPEIEPEIYFPAIHPLAQATSSQDLHTYPHWPDMHDPSRYAHLAAEAAALVKENRYAVIAAPWLLSPLERAFQLQGMQAFLIHWVDHPDFAGELLARITELCKIHQEHFLAEIGPDIDILILADDLGTQSSLLISPRMYRRVLKPLHAELIAFVKTRCRARIFFHSDGDIFPLLDDLVEIGVDILNPIQTTAGQMADLLQLKQRYGSELVFCGAIDTQRVLPFGTPAQVRDEVRRVMQSLTPNGGYLLAPVHSIPNETPPENILAMIAAALEFGKYPFRG